MAAYHRRPAGRNAHNLWPPATRPPISGRNDHRRPSPWQRSMRAFQDELHRNDPHSNTMEIFIVFPDDLVKLILSSNPRNLALARCINDWLKEALNAKPPPLCAACDHELADSRAVQAFVVGRSAFARESGHMLISGVCPQCVRLSSEELLNVYYASLEKIGLARGKLQQGAA